MKKRSKQYKPKQVVQNPLNYFFGGLKKVDENEMVELRTKNSLAMTRLCSGAGTKDDFDKIAGLLNMALVLDELHFDSHQDILLEGRDALLELGRRYKITGRFTFRGEEMKAVNAAMEVHDAQLDALRVIDIERATDEVQRRIRHNINVVKIKAEGVTA